MLKTGVVSVSFRALDVDSVIKITKEAGLKYIEWGSDVHAPYVDAEKIKYIAKAQKAAGISCSSYGTYFKLGEHGTNELYGYIEAAKILGTNVLRLWCGNKNHELLTPRERDFLISESKKAAKIAEQTGAILCMECHPNSFTNSLEGALDLMQSVNSPAFRMYWQYSHKATLEENVEYATKIAPYTENVHVFYFEEGKKKTLAAGKELWEKYIPCFSGTQHFLLEFMPDSRPESLPAEAAALCELASSFD